jgi:diguanylate cyclase (GGDEF)-like protein
VLCVAVGTVVIVNRVLATNLRDLTDAIRLAEKGKWLPTMKESKQREDEIGELSRSFDRLCATVTDLSVAVIDHSRELAWTKGELRLKEALSLLFEVTQTISAETELELILRMIPKRVAPALGFEEMAILLFDEHRQEFVVRATFGIPEEAVAGVTFPREDPICGAVADTGEPLVIPDTVRDSRYSHFKGKHPQDGAFACVPMKVPGRLVGMFNVLRPGSGSITDADLRLLNAIASYTALALVHLEMNLRLRDLSITDELTGVSNRRLLLERGAREIERARRTGHALAALMVDLDHFKKINDEFGHLRGDEVLRRVAGTLVSNVRRLDTVARYGGEEFVVLLPDSERAQALMVAEKLRAAVAGLEITPPLTISIGVAMFPEDAGMTATPDDTQALIDAADRALFRAKRSGRNRVVSFDRGQAA